MLQVHCGDGQARRAGALVHHGNVAEPGLERGQQRVCRRPRPGDSGLAHGHDFDRRTVWVVDLVAGGKRGGEVVDSAFTRGYRNDHIARVYPRSVVPHQRQAGKRDHHLGPGDDGVDRGRNLDAGRRRVVAHDTRQPIDDAAKNEAGRAAGDGGLQRKCERDPLLGRGRADAAESRDDKRGGGHKRHALAHGNQ